MSNHSVDQAQEPVKPVIDEVEEILPAGKLMMLGLQHVLVMYAGAVAVPLVIGDRLGLSKEVVTLLISSDLFCCGIVTLLQCIGIGKFAGIRLPVIMSVTFAAVTPMLAIGANPDIGLMGIFGATIAAGVLTTLIVPLMGKLMPLFPNMVTGIVITSIGLSIMQVGIDWAARVKVTRNMVIRSTSVSHLRFCCLSCLSPNSVRVFSVISRYYWGLSLVLCCR